MKPAASGLALLLLAACCASCGGSTTAPSKTVQVNIILATDGAFSATFQGTTITTQGVHTFHLDPGTYQVSGQMQSPFLCVAFARLGTGGVASDSIGAPSGPSPLVGHCDTSFLTLAPPQSFTVSFTVSASDAGACTVSTFDASACQGP